MIIAYISVESDRQTVFNFFKDQTPFLQADPFFFLLTAVLIFAFDFGPFNDFTFDTDVDDRQMD